MIKIPANLQLKISKNPNFYSDAVGIVIEVQKCTTMPMMISWHLMEEWVTKC